MNIHEPIRCLGPVSSGELVEAVLSLDESAWTEQTIRQDEYEVHRSTRSVVLLFCDGWPRVTVSREAGWDRLSGVALPVMHELIRQHYPHGGTIIRAMAASLPAGARIEGHVDTHPSFHRSHRIHVPISTNPGVRFMIDGRPYRMEVGQAYEINNQKRHSVMNKGSGDRIHYIFDYAPPENIDRGAAAA